MSCYETQLTRSNMFESPSTYASLSPSHAMAALLVSARAASLPGLAARALVAMAAALELRTSPRALCGRSRPCSTGAVPTAASFVREPLLLIVAVELLALRELREALAAKPGRRPTDGPNATDSRSSERSLRSRTILAS